MELEYLLALSPVKKGDKTKMELWKGKSARRAIEIFLALKEANIDGPDVRKIKNENWSSEFVVSADVEGDEEMEKSARRLVG